MSLFQPASRHQRKLRMALVGPSGSGKTYTALRIASALGQRIAVIDTERGSASVYADKFQFDVLQLTSFSPDKYLEGIQAASSAGYDVLIIDSLSHAWAGKDGILEFVDKVAARSGRGNSFGAWREATPVHNRLVDGILDAKPHVIVTMRAKTEYVQEKDERTGRTTVRKVGLQPVQRDGLEYEMDIVADLDWENNLIVTKTRLDGLQGHVEKQAGESFAGVIRDWLGSGAPALERPTPPPASKLGAPIPEDDEPVRLEGEPVQETLRAPGLSADAASRLHAKMGGIGLKPNQHKPFARAVLGRDVESFTDLTTKDAIDVNKVLERLSQGEVEFRGGKVVEVGPPEGEGQFPAEDGLPGGLFGDGAEA